MNALRPGRLTIAFFGSSLVSAYWNGAATYYRGLVARHGDGVVERLRELTPDRARQIGQAALRRILSEHTYAHRAAQVEAVLGVLTQPPARALSGAASAAGVEVLS